MQAVDERRLTDEELAERVGAEGSDALAALYERYFGGIYDFALRTLRDPDAAAGVTVSAFVKAWETMRKRQVKRVKACLYATAHNAALGEVKRRKRLVEGRTSEDGDGRFSSFTEADTRRLSNPEAVLQDQELIDLVWASAAALSPQDYALLDLHLRQDMSADELAQNLGLEKGAVYRRLSHLRDSLEESVASVLLMRRGRRDCADLNSLLVEMGASRVTPEVRRAVQNHLQDCPRCEGSRRRYPSPLEILAGLAPVPASASLRDAVWTRVLKRIEPRKTPPRPGRKMPQALVVGVLAAVVAAASAGGAYFAFRGGGLTDPDAASFTHDIGEGTSDALIGVEWTPNPDAAGYSISWSNSPELPDTTRDLPGNAGRATFTASPGEWWFNLRTEGRNGTWTSTVQLGPIIVLPLPDTRVVKTPGRLTSDSTPTFGFSATRPSTFECSVDGGEFVKCPPEATFASFGDGRHTLEVRARDRFGNADETPASFRFGVDTKRPRVSFTSVDLGDDDAAFAFRSSEKRVTYLCRHNDESWNECKSPVRLDGLADGEHTLMVRARDKAGNLGRPARRRWEVDTRPPETTITSGPSGDVDSNSATFTFTATEDGSKFECSRDGAAFAACTSPITYSGLSSGRHVFRVRAEDEAGNVDPSPAKRRWTATDNDPPNTHITSGPPAATRDATPRFSFTSSETGSTFECRIDGGAWRACSSPKTYPPLTPGAHIFRGRAIDAAGNRDPTPDTWEWVQSP